MRRMFDFLKKKVQAFTEKIKTAIEKKENKAEEKAIKEELILEKRAMPESLEKHQAMQEVKTEEIPEKEEIAKPVEAELEKEELIIEEIPKHKAEEPKPAIFEKKHEIQQPKLPGLEQKAETRPKALEIKEEDKHRLEAKKSIKTSLFGIFAKEITIEEADVKDFLLEFELALLESDVEQDAATAIVENIRKELVGRKASKKEDLSEFLKQEIRNSLKKVMHAEKQIDFWQEAGQKKPFKIMFLGPNGAGKTTSIAKIAFAFRQKGKKAVLASADTFRAGSIEQIEAHAERLGVRVVKHKYGADPAAVAFDAVKAAEADNADVVLIDTAGRQETNKNLMQELKKIARVIQPDLKIYVGEAYTGQALLQQASEFDKEIGIDGFILTKIDTDAKGGTAISLIYKLKKPIIFIGTGQEYSDLQEFAPEFIIDRIV